MTKTKIDNYIDLLKRFQKGEFNGIGIDKAIEKIRNDSSQSPKEDSE